MNGYFIKKIGENRGKPRIWLQNLEVSSAGLSVGDRYDIRFKGGVVSLQANPDGSRVVSHKPDRNGDPTIPVIDINSKELLALFDGMESIRLVQRKGEIFLLPLATEVKKKERLNRLKYKVENNIPLKMLSLSHGIGLLSTATRDGLAQAGLRSEKGLTNEIRGNLLEHASEVGDWGPNVVPVGAPMQDLAFDEGAMRHIGKHDGAELGLPCSGASVSGRARRKTSMPEEHPEVGHLIVAAIMIIARANPAFIVMENVIPYASSASAAILKTQLKGLGYVTHETVLKGKDFNALENRERWCMVAVTEGMHFDWSMLEYPEKRDIKLSDVMDDIPEDSPLWSEMTGLKAKQERDIAEGKNFLMQIFTPESTKIGTITKGYAKVRSTDPKIAHPTDPNLLRQITVSEHAKVMQWPPGIVANLAKTIAHEGLGQGVLREPFERAAKAVGIAIVEWTQGKTPTQKATLAFVEQQLASRIEESASMVVSEIRAPQPGVIYEGPVTVADEGVVIQDIGNGVGILHKASSLDVVKLGETLEIRYPSKSAVPTVLHLDRPPPAATPELTAAIAASARAGAEQRAQEHQLPIFSEPEPRQARPYFGPRM